MSLMALVASVQEFRSDHPELEVLGYQVTPYGTYVEYRHRRADNPEENLKYLKKEWVVAAQCYGGTIYITKKKGKSSFNLNDADRFYQQEAEERARWATIKSKTGTIWRAQKIR